MAEHIRGLLSAAQPCGTALEGLAPIICDVLMDAFTKLAADGNHTIILVEQHADLALEFAENLIILDNGEIVFQGASSQIQFDRSILEQQMWLGMSDD